MEKPSKYAYFVVNDSDDLEELQQCLVPFGGIEAIKDVIIDYALDKRRILDLIKCCNKHDIIYTPYLARLGKSLKELFQIVSIANEHDVNLIFCDKLNVSFSETNLNGKINLASLQWAVDLDFAIRSECNKAHAAKRRDAIIRDGSFITKNGRNILQLGRPKRDPDNPDSYNLSGIEASAMARHKTAILWKENSKAYKRALDKFSQGWTLAQIVEDLSDLYDIDPDNYCTPKGCKPTKGTISRWLSEAKDKEDNVNI